MEKYCKNCANVGYSSDSGTYYCRCDNNDVEKYGWCSSWKGEEEE